MLLNIYFKMDLIKDYLRYKCVIIDIKPVNIDFIPVIDGKHVHSQIYKVIGYTDISAIDYDAPEGYEYHAVMYVFMYNNKVYYIDCKHIQYHENGMDEDEWSDRISCKGLPMHIKSDCGGETYYPIISTAYTAIPFDDNIKLNNMYKYKDGIDPDDTSLYYHWTDNISDYTSEYHTYESQTWSHGLFIHWW